MPHIAFAALEGCLASSIALPSEMLVAAASRPDNEGLELRIAAENGEAVHALGGLTLTAHDALEALTDVPPDLLFLPALWRNPLPALRRCRRLLPVLAELARAGTRLCAVGSSSFFLAEAGLLAARPATTHWFYLNLFARRYPDIELKRHHLITRAGTLYCAGSVNSVADLTVHFIEQFYGTAVARAVEAQFSPEIRRPVAANVFSQGEENLHQDEVVAEAQGWLANDLAQAPDLSNVAIRLGISTRTLSRRFRRATGQTPRQYLQGRRLALARELLKSTNLSVGEIAAQTGFQNASAFGRFFRVAVGQTPAAWRRTVRAKLFAV